jgi:hypothetical protein
VLLLIRIKCIHCKKRLSFFPSPAGMSLTKLSLAGNNLINNSPGRVWLVTSRLGTEKSTTFFKMYFESRNYFPHVLLAYPARKVVLYFTYPIL